MKPLTTVYDNENNALELKMICLSAEKYIFSMYNKAA